jgi:ADP-heptose:LPS heptosyltransferase
MALAAFRKRKKRSKDFNLASRRSVWVRPVSARLTLTSGYSADHRMIAATEKQPINFRESDFSSHGKLDAKRVTVVYTMFHHLGDFVVLSGLLKKFDLLKVEFESLVAHQNSTYTSSFDGDSKGRFFNIATIGGLFSLVAKLRQQKKQGRLIFGIPMAPGSIQAFCFFWLLKKLGALTYIVDFNLINADIITPPRRRYLFDRHLAQAAELFKHPEWMEDASMPLAFVFPAATKSRSIRQIGFFPWSGRSWLPEFQWPESHWLALAKLIFDTTDLEIVLLGKDKNFNRFEQRLRSQLAEQMQRRFVARPTASIEALAVSLREVEGIITVNTSALHLAHALKLPTIALCGSSAEFWLPEGDHVHLVRDTKGVLPPSDQYHHDPLQPSLQRIEVAEVYAAFEQLSQRWAAKSPRYDTRAT